MRCRSSCSPPCSRGSRAPTRSTRPRDSSCCCSGIRSCTSCSPSSACRRSRSNGTGSAPRTSGASGCASRCSRSRRLTWPGDVIGGSQGPSFAGEMIWALGFLAASVAAIMRARDPSAAPELRPLDDSPLRALAPALGVVGLLAVAAFSPSDYVVVPIALAAVAVVCFTGRAFVIQRENRLAQANLESSEEQHRTLVDNIPGAVYRCAFDDQWTIDFMSGAIEELTGYPAESFVGSRINGWTTIEHPEDAEAAHRGDPPRRRGRAAVRARVPHRPLRRRGPLGARQGPGGVRAPRRGALARRRPARRHRPQAHGGAVRASDRAPLAAPAGRRRGERGAGGRRGAAGLPRRGLRVHGLARRPRRRAQRGRGRARLDRPLVDLDRRDRRGCALPCRERGRRASCPATACRGRCSSPAGRSGSRTSPPTPPIAGSLPRSSSASTPRSPSPCSSAPRWSPCSSSTARSRRQPDDSLLRVMANVGTVLGRVVERTRSERALAAQNEQLRQLDALKDEFVSLVSHELRTPLTSIRGYLELIVEDGDRAARGAPPVPRGRPAELGAAAPSRRRPALRRAARRRDASRSSARSSTWPRSRPSRCRPRRPPPSPAGSRSCSRPSRPRSPATAPGSPS